MSWCGHPLREGCDCMMAASPVSGSVGSMIMIENADVVRLFGGEDVDRLHDLHLVYVTDGNAGTLRSRGGFTFAKWARSAASRSVLVGQSITGRLPTARLRILMTATPWPASADFVEKFMKYGDVRIVLDVTGPVLHPEALDGEIARDLWSTTDAQKAVKRQLAAATAVITPHVRWIDLPDRDWVVDLRRYTKAPIRVVPDVVDDATCDFFTDTLTEVFTSSDLWRR